MFAMMWYNNSQAPNLKLLKKSTETWKFYLSTVKKCLRPVTYKAKALLCKQTCWFCSSQQLFLGSPFPPLPSWFLCVFWLCWYLRLSSWLVLCYSSASFNYTHNFQVVVSLLHTRALQLQLQKQPFPLAHLTEGLGLYVWDNRYMENLARLCEKQKI